MKDCKNKLCPVGGCYLRNVCIKDCFECPDRFYCFTTTNEEWYCGYIFHKEWHDKYREQMYYNYERLKVKDNEERSATVAQ